MGFGGFMKGLGKGLLKAAPIAAGVIPGLGAVGAIAKMGKFGSILGKAGEVAGAMSPVLGQAAGARADAKKAEAADTMVRDQINQRADIENQGLPALRMKNAYKGALALNGPVSVNMIKPGEGRLGKTTQFTGGANSAMDPRYLSLASQTLDDTLQAHLTGSDKVRGATPDPGSSGLDKALAIGSFGAGAMGAINTLRKPKPTTGGVPGIAMPGSEDMLKNVRF